MLLVCAYAIRYTSKGKTLFSLSLLACSRKPYLSDDVLQMPVKASEVPISCLRCYAVCTYRVIMMYGLHRLSQPRKRQIIKIAYLITVTLRKRYYQCKLIPVYRKIAIPKYWQLILRCYCIKLVRSGARD